MQNGLIMRAAGASALHANVLRVVLEPLLALLAASVTGVQSQWHTPSPSTLMKVDDIDSASSNRPAPLQKFSSLVSLEEAAPILHFGAHSSWPAEVW